MTDEDATPPDANRQADQEPDRQAQPVDAEQPPRLPFPVVGIGASAGGLEAVGQFLDAMPPDGGMAFVLIQHLPPDRDSMMADILGRRTRMPVRQVEDGMAVEANHVYVIRPGHVLTIRDGRLHLGPPLGSARAANRPVDDFFKSLAAEQRERAICVVLSGMGSNGTAGAQVVKAVGGLCVAQEPETAQFPSMPRNLIDAGYADYVLAPADMPEVLLGYADHPYARGGREADAAVVLRQEHQHLREVLAILRARTRQDFAGYKKPTLLRRVQRRMGLSRTQTVGDYAKLLRQTPAEATALADDLLIHVTGFFRDPDAWDALRKHVIAPLIAARESGAAVRGWVTACSTGEEAYTLAMLLVEAAERAGKQLDIKVFATDLADRALDHARDGVYPGGIESEILPERLERFFTPSDEQYRVRPELRDRVVFASQNILQDPPFSRIDVASCRNLLIYLEPEMQQRVLGLLHFGLRDGGALFLGSAETVAGVEDMFEPIDKKARIFRRVGPTRHWSAEFPLPHAVPAGDDRAGVRAGIVLRAAACRPDGPRPSVEQLSHRALLAGHTPPAVTVDRDGRVLYYHGATWPFLQQLSGEPVRELMLLCQVGVRGAVRAALGQAAAQNARAVATDGWAEFESGRRVAVTVTATPLADDEAAGDPPKWFVVSFAERGEQSALTPASTDPGDEAHRLRAELSRTIEEQQTGNEELRASNEEVMSINEELQSANEELETSKEEMQSLNEELTTVNAQLRVKMDEYQEASSDLSSLLTSTDIAVLFLDTAFRIRRFTPAVRDLVDLIASDVGRPLAALARRFDDPHLDDDVRVVLERLTPVERVVASAGGRHYLRQVLPYRTTDNRIAGVVVTFVDITSRKRAEDAVRASEEQFRRAIEDAPIPVIMQADDGQVLQVSRTWTELTGYTLADVPTLEAWLTRAYGPGANAVRTHMHELFKGERRALDVEFAIRTRDGAERLWNFNASAPGALRDGRRFLVGMAVDVTDRRRAEAAAQANEGLARAVIAGLPSAAAFVIGHDLRYTLAAGGALATAGFTAADFEGKSLGEALPPALVAEYEPLYRQALAGEPFRAEHVAHGRNFASHGLPLRDAAGRVTSALAVSYDITDRVRAEEQVRESEGRLQLALAAARMGIWTLDVEADRHTRDAHLNRLLGLDPVETTQSFAGFLDHVHTDDRAAVRGAFALAIRERRMLNVEFRVVHPNGAVRWLRDQGDVLGGGGGRQMTGACADVTDRKEAEAALQAGEERLRLIVESATDFAILTLAPDRAVTSWSPGAEAVFGWAEAEIVGRSVDDLFTPEDRAAGASEAEAETALRDGRAADERWHLRKDGSRFYASGVLSKLAAGGPRGFVKVARDLTPRKRMEDELRSARDQLEGRVAERTVELRSALDALEAEMARRADLARRLATAQEDERRRIARDLHDTVGQTLTGLTLAVAAVTAGGPLPPTAVERLEQVRLLADNLGRELHEVALLLRPTALDDIGLETAVRTLAADWSRRTGLVVQVTATVADGRLPTEVETALYRVVQEALTNVARHAGASRVSVVLGRRDADAVVVVEDDGAGFDPDVVRTPTPGRRGGLGLAGMRERVGLLGGAVEVESESGRGTTVIARLPLENRP